MPNPTIDMTCHPEVEAFFDPRHQHHQLCGEGPCLGRLCRDRQRDGH